MYRGVGRGRTILSITPPTIDKTGQQVSTDIYTTQYVSDIWTAPAMALVIARGVTPLLALHLASRLCFC